ncbi:MAG: hypothetical protein Q9190_005938 [Brigantiaea leucoxantha]
MVVPKVSARWTPRLLNFAKRGARVTVRTRSGQKVQSRTYASEGKQEKSYYGSDLPWAIGSSIVTIPSVIYLLQPREKEHGHGHGHDKDKHAEETQHEESGDEKGSADEEKGESEGEKGEEGSGEEQGESSVGGGTASQSNGDSASDSDKREAKTSTGESEGENGEQVTSQDTPESSGSDSQTADVSSLSKGPMVDGGPEGTIKREPSKGGTKIRLDSGYRKRQGELEEEQEGGEDKAAASKDPGGFDTQSGKQEGIANTDTRHSTDIENDPEKSKKGEGTIETAKLKGTVDPRRPSR